MKWSLRSMPSFRANISLTIVDHLNWRALNVPPNIANRRRFFGDRSVASSGHRSHRTADHASSLASECISNMEFGANDGSENGSKSLSAVTALAYACSSEAVQFQTGALTAEYRGASCGLRPGQCESR